MNLLVELLRSIWAIKTIFSHDVFIFGFGHSLMRFNLDLPLIKILGKKTISNLSHGSEARPPYINGFIESNKGKKEPSIKELVNLSKFIKRRIQWHSRFCDTIICTPFCSQFLEKPFINVYNLYGEIAV